MEVDMKRDNLHFNFRTIDGYNLPFNAIISEREAGKSTAAWIDKAYAAFLKGRSSLVIRRRIADITEVYINDIGEVINKFLDEPIVLKFKKGSIKDGIVDVYVQNRRFIRVIALSNPMSRIKSTMIRNIDYIIFDEFICNTRVGEKYLPNEAFIFSELYNTYRRENKDVKCYFLGNPYSVYNPYFCWFGADLSKIKPGVILHGKNWVIQAYQIKEELKRKILEENPLYEFDDAYKRYAFDGIAINDEQIRVCAKQPENFYLWIIIRTESTFISVYKNKTDDTQNRFWCKREDDILSAKRTAVCFDLNELINKTAMYTLEDRLNNVLFKAAIGNREVLYEDVGIGYLIQNIYMYL